MLRSQVRLQLAPPQKPSVDDWIRANEIRAYLDAMKSTIDTLQDVQAASEASLWANAHLATVDPLMSRLGMPADHEPKPEDLTPFLHGWNPYGPG